MALAGLFLAPAAVRAQNSSSLLTGNGPGATNGTFAIKNINVGFPKTPEFTTIGSETQAKRYTLGTWMEIEVEFLDGPGAEVAFHYNVAIAGKLLTGDQTLEDVPAGQSLFHVMYVAPRTLTTMLKGQPVTVNAPAKRPGADPASGRGRPAGDQVPERGRGRLLRPGAADSRVRAQQGPDAVRQPLVGPLRDGQAEHGTLRQKG